MLDVIYEDNQIVVVIKPQNVPSQADITGDPDMLSLVKAYVKEKYNKKGEAFIGLVHRLDRPTGGVMVFARNSKSANRLSAQIQFGEFEKTYLAVVKGAPKLPKGHIETYIKKDAKENKASLSTMSEKGAKKAVLDYELVQTKDALTLLKVQIETGRSHQIRLQLSTEKMPIFGDAKYGSSPEKAKTSNLALFASELRFKHPTEDKVMVFKVSPPDVYPWTNFDFN